MPTYNPLHHVHLPRQLKRSKHDNESRSQSHSHEALAADSTPAAQMSSFPNPLPLSELLPKASSIFPVTTTTTSTTDKAALPTSPQRPQRPRHLTARSITEISPSAGEKSKLHSRHHPHIHRHHKHKRRESGIETDIEGATRSEGVTPEQSRDVSRRGSMFGGLDASLEAVKVVREGEVREERERGVLRATELRTALVELNALSNNTTRRLDNTYYSVLEKLSVLQNTIGSMQELATMTRQLNDEFEQDSGEVVADVTTQLETFEGFTDQETRITKLAERVQGGRERIKTLGERVEVVKSRVEGWEAAEAGWKDKTRKRLRVMWIVMAVVGTLVVGVVLVQRYVPGKTVIPGGEGTNYSGMVGEVPTWLNGENRTLSAETHAERVLQALREKERMVVEDERLRVFDEL